MTNAEANQRKRANATLRAARLLTARGAIGYLRGMTCAFARARTAVGVVMIAAIIATYRAAPALAASPRGTQRIVSLAPSVTETLFALGAGDEVVGVSQYCDYPPAATRLPRVGSFLTPNVEAIIGLRPTLVIGLGLSSDTRELGVLAATGCGVMVVSDDSLAEIEAGIVSVGAKIDRPDAAHAMISAINSQIDSVRAKVAGTRRVRVLMLVGHEPIFAVGRRTYLDDLLTLANSENVADSSSQQWPELSIEYIIAARPDVILEGQMGSDAEAPRHYWDRYPIIPAVRNHR
ncbi:MAG: ABC transporter substrate-binding protein, partial [Candidatus Binataceae bacterium]